MVFWILAGLIVHLVGVFLPTFLYLPTEGIQGQVGPHDAQPEPNKMTMRARRAQANMQENLPFFLTLGVLALVVPGANLSLAITGAIMFVLARVFYIPSYLLALNWIRSGFYTIGLIGCGVMAWALLQAA